MNSDNKNWQQRQLMVQAFKALRDTFNEDMALSDANRFMRLLDEYITAKVRYMITLEQLNG